MSTNIAPHIPHCTACGEKLRSAEDTEYVNNRPYCGECVDYAADETAESQVPELPSHFQHLIATHGFNTVVKALAKTCRIFSGDADCIHDSEESQAWERYAKVFEFALKINE